MNDLCKVVDYPYALYAPDVYIAHLKDPGSTQITVYPGDLVVVLARFKSGTDEGVALVLSPRGEVGIMYGGGFETFTS